jgi:adenylate cyclase class 2
MDIEYEAKFADIDKDDVRKRLNNAGAKLIRPEFLQKRVVFHAPKEKCIDGRWVRVRDEGDKTTMSIKISGDGKIEEQKEICLTVDNYEKARSFLIHLGCKEKAYHETKRELWMLDNVEITIDEWPFLEPFVEVEGQSKEEVKGACEKLGFDYKKAIFGAVDQLYEAKYGVSKDVINNQTPEITFSGKNPFEK